MRTTILLLCGIFNSHQNLLAVDSTESAIKADFAQRRNTCSPVLEKRPFAETTFLPVFTSVSSRYQSPAASQNILIWLEVSSSTHTTRRNAFKGKEPSSSQKKTTVALIAGALLNPGYIHTFPAPLFLNTTAHHMLRHLPFLWITSTPRRRRHQ
jgi:hypothetical protein